MNRVSNIGKGTSSRRRGKTPSVDWLGVAQRFTAAISGLSSEMALAAAVPDLSFSAACSECFSVKKLFPQPHSSRRLPHPVLRQESLDESGVNLAGAEIGSARIFRCSGIVV